MTNKPEKPYSDFPLYAHGNGQWAKKIKGKTRTFGVWSDWRSALEKYLEERDELQAGRRPRSRDCVTVAELADSFYDAKLKRTGSDELSQRTLSDYDAVCKFLVKHLGEDTDIRSLTVADFTALRAKAFQGLKKKTIGKVAAGNRIRLARIIFKWADDAKLIEKPIDFGPEFKVPTKRSLRREKLTRPKREFTAHEIRLLLRATPQPIRAMILLGINCGLGNTDCGLMTFEHFDLDGGWLDYPRNKTSVLRSAKLWPQTVSCLRDAIDRRPSDKTDDTRDLVFLTRHRQSWYRDTSDSPVSNEIAKTCTRLGMKRFGVNFYALRHTLETVGGEVGDQVALNHVMGHSDESMAALYTTTIFQSRLIRIADHVRNWLFPVTQKDTL